MDNVDLPTFMSRILPLVEEHVLCSMKIKQLRTGSVPGVLEEQAARTEILTILLSLQQEDEKRMIEELRQIST